MCDAVGRKCVDYRVHRGAMVAASPHPLTPIGLCRQRVLSVATVIGGKSSARGMR